MKPLSLFANGAPPHFIGQNLALVPCCYALLEEVPMEEQSPYNGASNQNTEALVKFLFGDSSPDRACPVLGIKPRAGRRHREEALAHAHLTIPAQPATARCHGRVPEGLRRVTNSSAAGDQRKQIRRLSP